MPCSWHCCFYCCCCCQCDTNIDETQNNDGTGDGRNTDGGGQWGISLDSQYDTLSGSLIIACEESDTCREYVHRSLHILNTSIPIIIVEAILVLVFGLMFIFGCKYNLDCPMQPMLIIYHIIGGGVGFLFWLWSMVRALRRRRQESGLEEEDDDTEYYDAHTEEDGGGVRLKDNGLWFMELIAFLFLLIWFVIGNYWTWSIFWPAPTMTERQPVQWCDHSLYIFTLISTGIVYVLAIFVILFNFSFIIFARYCARVLDNE